MATCRGAGAIAPEYPLKPDVSRGPPGLRSLRGPGPLGPPVIRPLVNSTQVKFQPIKVFRGKRPNWRNRTFDRNSEKKPGFPFEFNSNHSSISLGFGDRDSRNVAHGGGVCAANSVQRHFGPWSLQSKTEVHIYTSVLCHCHFGASHFRPKDRSDIDRSVHDLTRSVQD